MEQDSGSRMTEAEGGAEGEQAPAEFSIGDGSLANSDTEPAEDLEEGLTHNAESRRGTPGRVQDEPGRANVRMLKQHNLAGELGLLSGRQQRQYNYQMAF